MVDNRPAYTKDDLKELIKPLPRDAHKGDRGGLLITGGSWNYRGAPLLAALGALRAGTGFVVLASPDFLADAASVFLPEAVFVPLRTANDEICPDDVPDTLAPWVGRCGAAVFGPGLGRGEGAKELTQYFWTRWKKPLLIDADALYFFAELRDELPYRANAVITPHAGEAGRILGLDAAQVNADRLASALELAKYAGVALLKGKGTLVCQKEECRVISEGSPVLAVPGSGDVLSGAVGALLASGMETFDAATAGALLHAAAGSRLEEKIGINGILAREIADEMPAIFG